MMTLKVVIKTIHKNQFISNQKDVTLETWERLHYVEH